eukprot:TRINITY_DN2189_c0_g1_i3.p1 TRINITY_DN2189_c0_g1~~TRINITY_DN2189_c0_g1_i3.p1  ORF type:complete len:238 (-),score=42.64 TRINITY_DN2189_c0_g1_i3:108-821(-)
MKAFFYLLCLALILISNYGSSLQTKVDEHLERRHKDTSEYKERSGSPSALVIAADGVEEIELVTILDVLKRGGFSVVSATPQASLQLKGMNGISITLQSSLRDAISENKSYDVVVLPGGVQNSKTLAASEDVIDLLKEQKKSGRYYAAICASPAIVLNGKEILSEEKWTGYPGIGPKNDNWEDTSVVVDGKLITSQGPGTAIEFALKIVDNIISSDKAESLRKGLLFDRYVIAERGL